MGKKNDPSTKSRRERLDALSCNRNSQVYYVWVLRFEGFFGSYLTFDASQAAATCLRVAEALAVTTTVLPGDPQLMQLPLLLLVDLLHASCFEQCIAAFRWIRLEERALIQVGSTDVDVLLRDVVYRQSIRFLAFLGSILCQLKQRRQPCSTVALGK